MQSARVIGLYGAGKTEEAGRIMGLVLDTDVRDPMRVGYVTFTRSARREAARRAAAKFGLSANELEQHGWFKTLHSVAYKCLGVAKAQVVSGSKNDITWIQNAIQAKLHIEADENGDAVFQSFSPTDDPAGYALAAWDAARNRLLPFKDVYQERARDDTRFPKLEYCEKIIGMYEESKSNDDRIDFADMLLKFSGWKMGLGGPTRCLPEGMCPCLPVWFHDEAQDSSRLTFEAFKRLALPAQWVYIFLDPNQEIYTWAGADTSLFMNWPCEKERTLMKTYRCSANIVRIAEHMMSVNPHWKHRQVVPARDGGVVHHCDTVLKAVSELGDMRGLMGNDLRESVLCLARTNDGADNMAHALNQAGVPWKPIKSRGGFDAPAQLEAFNILWKIRDGDEICGREWARVLEFVHVKVKDVPMLVHGIKKHFEDEQNQNALMPFTIDFLSDVGATEHLINAIREGEFSRINPKFTRFEDAAKKFGIDAINNPRVQVGTIHASKGMEADHVILDAAIAKPTKRAGDLSPEMMQECKVWHVACSRARKRLTVANTRGGFAAFRGLEAMTE